MMPKFNKHIFICTNERDKKSPRGDCGRCGGLEIRTSFSKLINQNGLKGIVRSNKSGCLDACELGPVVVIYPDNIWYTEVKLDDVEEIFESSILRNDVVERLVADKETWNRLEMMRKKS